MTARKYDPICTYTGCGRAHNSHGLCGPHGVMQRRGEMLRPIQGRTGPIARPSEERFAARTRQQDDGCIVWTGGKTLGGYGMFASRPTRQNGRLDMAHRWAYEHSVGPIPSGFDIDHLCRNRACVNTDHLEPVTRQENIRRAAAFKTHCKSGHAFTYENTYIRPGTVHRRCRTCATARDHARAPITNAIRRAFRAALRDKE